MALSVDQDNFTKSTGGAPASQAVTGVGFQPVALILWVTAQTSAGVTAEYQSSFGFSDGTTDFSAAGTCKDSVVLVSNTDRRHASKVLTMLSNDGNGTTIAECDVTSFDSDGFTLSWTTNDSNAYIIHYLAIGGDLTNADVGFWVSKAGTGNQSVTGIGFESDAIIFFGGVNALDPPDTKDSLLNMMGMAVSSSQRGTVSDASQSGVIGTRTARYQRTDKCISVCQGASGGPVLVEEADLVSMDSDGFTIDWTTWGGGIERYGYLCLKGGNYFIGDESQKTSTGTKATTGVGFEPKGLFIEAFNRTATTSPQDHARLSIGGASAAGSEGSTWAGDTDNISAFGDASHTDKSISTTKVLHHIDTDNPTGVDAEADLDSFDSDGFTLDWTTADAVARQFLFLAMGDDAVATIPNRIYQVEQAAQMAFQVMPVMKTIPIPVAAPATRRIFVT